MPKHQNWVRPQQPHRGSQDFSERSPGCVNVILIEATAVMHGNGRGVLALLFSSSAVSSQIGHTSALQIALLLLIEVAGNVAGFVLLFVVPAALVVGVVRVFQRRKTNAVP